VKGERRKRGGQGTAERDEGEGIINSTSFPSLRFPNLFATKKIEDQKEEYKKQTIIKILLCLQAVAQRG
jgi:hypothetical protein